MKSYANDFVGQRYRVESSIGEVVSQGTATITANYGTIAWGPAKFGNITYFHTYFLKIEGGKVTEIRINPKERFENQHGDTKYIGTESEVKRLYEVMIGALCENEALLKRKQETREAVTKRLTALAERNNEIRIKRQELKVKLSNLCSDKTLAQQLADPEILKLSNVGPTLNTLHPERKSLK